ncbi:MAG: Mov34/MPN/PAD-1 family protein [Candidatus Acidiferrales bacterium]
MLGAIEVRSKILATILEHAHRDPVKECCGLLAGRDGVITRAFPAANAAGDAAVAYEIALEELFRLMRAIRAEKLELLGIYHSHPGGDNRPSAHDVERAYYPDVAYFIISPRTDTPGAVRAFSIRSGNVTELELRTE